MKPLIQINNLSLDFVSQDQRTRAIRNISFSVDRGEVLALVGESGSGKTVTALSILQLIPAPPAIYSGGEILFSENGSTTVDLLATDRRTLQSIRGNKVAMIFQEPMTSLNPVISCGEQVVESIRQHRRLSKQAAKQSAIEWFEKVKLPNASSIFNRYPHQLSGGQKQRVMIAMAMCCQPSLLICDEPTTALDVTVQKTILQLIRELQKESNMGVIFITHDLGVVGEIADRAAVMYKGEIVEQNNTSSIFRQPEHPYTRALLACRPINHPRGERLPVVSDFLDRKEAKAARPVLPTDKLTNSMKGPDALIKVEELSVWFPSRRSLIGRPSGFVKAVDEVSFEVLKGETLGLVGESGCGKTTLGRAILRLIPATKGRILYKGEDLALKKGAELRPMRKQIQIVFQDPYSSLNPRLSIGEAIAEPLKVHGLVNNQRQRKEKVMALLEKVNLNSGHYRRYPHEFSGGQRQRIVIARALALEPSFIVCDESVSALDISVQAQVLNLLNDLKKEFGFTMIFISHDLSVVRYISDRIMVMNKGKIEETGDAEEIYHHPKTAYSQSLIAAIPKGIETAMPGS